MMAFDNSRALQSAKDSFTDVNSLDSVKKMGRNKDPEALLKIAKQFESMFMQQMLKNMRSTNEVFGKDNFLNSNETQFHQQMFDHQMSLEMTAGKGIGLADVLYRQMSAQYSGEFLERDQKGDDLDIKASNNSNPFADGLASLKIPKSGIDEELKALATAEIIPNSIGKKNSALNSIEEFIQQLLPQAKQAAKDLNTKPEVLLAQAALETGWGKHVIHNNKGENSHNLFNIKADSRWDGESVRVPTLEFKNGVAAKEQASFRQYNSYAESFNDYVNFIQDNPRYQKALTVASDVNAYATELQKAGYATDPNYAEKIQRLTQSDAIKQASRNLQLADAARTGEF